MALTAGLSLIVPVHLNWEQDDPQLAATAQRLQAAGVEACAFIGPGLPVRLAGMLTLERCRAMARSARKAKDLFATYGIRAGFWYAPTLKAGPNPWPAESAEHDAYEFGHIIGPDGTVAAVSYCPLNPKYRGYFGKCLAIIAEEMNPPFILLEDDYELSNHPGVKHGCYCPDHLQAFAEQVGRRYSREELHARFQETDGDAIALKRQWAALACDSLVGLASHLRQSLDEVAPETRLGLCEPGCADRDGEMTLPVVRALAGKTRPLVRLHGTTYASDDPTTLPDNIFHAMYVGQRRGPEVEWLHECDTYPHTGYYTSAARLASLVTAAIMAGADGALYYALQYLDNPTEDARYLTALEAQRAQWEALRGALKTAHPAGVEIVHRPDAHAYLGAMRGGSSSPWPRILGLHGIPYTTRGGAVRFVAGDAIAVMSEQELDELFASPVVLDGRAAWHATQRGRGEDMGLTAEPMKRVRSLRERFTLDPAWGTPPGHLMYFLAAFPAGAEASIGYNLTPTDRAQILGEFVGLAGESAGASMTLHHNRRGGRVAVLAFDLAGNRSSSIFNYRRGWLLRRLASRLGGEAVPVMVERDPKVFCLASQTDDGQSLICSITNLSLDPLEEVVLSVQPRWRNAVAEQLHRDGTWQPIPAFDRADGSQNPAEVTLPIGATVAQPILLRFTRPSSKDV